jgi:hypothetical protein
LANRITARNARRLNHDKAIFTEDWVTIPRNGRIGHDIGTEAVPADFVTEVIEGTRSTIWLKPEKRLGWAVQA